MITCILIILLLLTNIFLPFFSASYDTTVKLWDVERGRLLHSLDRHRCVISAYYSAYELVNL